MLTSLAEELQLEVNLLISCLRELNSRKSENFYRGTAEDESFATLLATGLLAGP